MKVGILGSLLAILTLIIANNVTYAATINTPPVVCKNMVVLKATAKNVEYHPEEMYGGQVSIDVVKNKDDVLRGSQTITVGQKQVEVNLMINSAPNISGVLEFSQATWTQYKSESDQWIKEREVLSGVLIKNAGVGKNNVGDQGPDGAIQWRLMHANSFSEDTMHARLFASVLTKLQQYGVKSIRIEDTNDLLYVYKKVAEAVGNHDLVEGEPIGTALYMGCYQMPNPSKKP